MVLYCGRRCFSEVRLLDRTRLHRHCEQAEYSFVYYKDILLLDTVVAWDIWIERGWCCKLLSDTEVALDISKVAV